MLQPHLCILSHFIAKYTRRQHDWRVEINLVKQYGAVKKQAKFKNKHIC